MAQAGGLYSQIMLEDGSFQSTVKRVNRAQASMGTQAAKTAGQVASSYRTLDAGLERVSGRIKGFGAAVVASLSVGALVGLARAGLDYASALGETAEQLGVSSEAMQRYRYIASQTGIEQDAMDKALQRLTRTIGEAASGSKAQAEAFNSLGISVRDANGDVRDAADIIPELADKYSQMSSAAERAATETKFFGKAGQQLDPMLKLGAAGLKEMSDEAERLGLIMSEALIAKADAAADKLSTLEKVLQVQVATAVAENADGILSFADAFVSLISGVGDAIHWLKKFAHESRQAVNAAQGWTPWGGRAGGENAMRARSAYLQESLRWDEVERDRAKGAKTIRTVTGTRRGNGQSNPVAGGGGRSRGAGDAERAQQRAAEQAQQRDQLRLEQELAIAEARGDAARVAALKEQVALRERVQQWERAGLKASEAQRQALIDRSELTKAEAEQREKLIALAMEETALSDARGRGDWEHVANLERQLHFRERLAYWTEKMGDAERANRQATQDLLVYDEQRLAAREKLAALDERQRQIELARVRGDDPDKIRAMESADGIERRTDDLMRERDMSASEARAQAEREAAEMNRAYNQGYWKDTFRGAFRAALDGDLGGWFENWWKDRVSKAMDGILDKLFDSIDTGNGGGGFLAGIGAAFGKLFGGNKIAPGDGANGMSTVFSTMPRLPGLNNGGEFAIGGTSAVSFS